MDGSRFCSLVAPADIPAAYRSHLAPFFNRAVAYLAESGLCLEIRRDFGELARINAERCAAGDWDELMPMFNPAFWPAIDGHWLRLVNGEGETVGTIAARADEMASLRDGLVSLHALYGDDPPPRDHCTISEGHRSSWIGGRIVYGGGGWVHPAYRDARVFGMLLRLNKALALALLGTRECWGLADEKEIARGIRYGVGSVDPGITWHRSITNETFRLSLLISTPEDVLADLGAWIRRAQAAAPAAS